jgi:hypothetical protein
MGIEMNSKTKKKATLHGHPIQIGSTLGDLLRELCLDINAFHQYLRDHAKVLVPCMQGAPKSKTGSSASPPTIEVSNFRRLIRGYGCELISRPHPKNSFFAK